MKTQRELRNRSFFRVKLIMEFPKEEFVKDIDTELFAKLLGGESSFEEERSILYHEKERFQEKFGTYHSRRSISIIINMNIRLYYLLKFLCKGSVEEFFGSVLDEDNPIVNTIIKFGLYDHLNVTDLFPVFYPALVWYRNKKTEHQYSPELIEDMEKFQKLLDKYAVEDCFRETQYANLRISSYSGVSHRTAVDKFMKKRKQLLSRSQKKT